MAHTLIVRYNRIGDALITLPLIYDLANKYKNDKFTVLSYCKFEFLFKYMPSNVTFIPMIAKSQTGMFRGVSYLIKREIFVWKMKRLVKQFDKIAMLQFDTYEKKLYKYFSDKQKENTAFSDNSGTRLKKNKHNSQDYLSMTDLHIETFNLLGYNDIKPFYNSSLLKNSDITNLSKRLKLDLSKKIIAIAPFSREKSKIYPLDKMEKVANYFANNPDKYQVLILGGGKKEDAIINSWIKKSPNIISLINKLSFEDEVHLISHSNVVLTMDSANLHLASLLDIPVISIWGATIPQCGYYPKKEPLDMAIIKDVNCQPCSLFGKEDCTNPKLYDCLDINPQVVIDKVESVLKDNTSK